jgi:hypothetical protein
MIVYNNSIIITPSRCGRHSLEKIVRENEENNYVRISGDASITDSLSTKVTFGAIVPNDLNHLERVLLVRNPYERLMSIAMYAMEPPEKINKNVMTSDIDSFLRSIRYERQVLKVNGLKLEDEDNSIIPTDFAFLTTHITIWHMALSDYLKLSNPKYTVRLENAIKDFEKIGIKFDNFPHEFKNTNKTEKTLKDFYKNQEILDFANVHFSCAEDSIKLGYKPIYRLDDLYENAGLVDNNLK